MKAKVYGIRNCDTMKKALAWLESRKVAYDFHDYKKEGIAAPKLKEWAARTGWEQLANTRGTTWRKIPDAQKANHRGARARPARAEHQRNQAARGRGRRQAAGRLRPRAIRRRVL